MTPDTYNPFPDGSITIDTVKAARTEYRQRFNVNVTAIQFTDVLFERLAREIKAKFHVPKNAVLARFKLWGIELSNGLSVAHPLGYMATYQELTAPGTPPVLDRLDNCTCPMGCPLDCKGQCGCQACREAWADQQSGREE